MGVPTRKTGKNGATPKSHTSREPNNFTKMENPMNLQKKLVISGYYSYVRNPMYVGVFLIISGIFIIYINYLILIYGMLLLLFINTFIMKYEEPKLTQTFGEQYLEYCKNVHRWIPRIKAWRK